MEKTLATLYIAFQHFYESKIKIYCQRQFFPFFVSCEIHILNILYDVILNEDYNYFILYDI